MKVVVCHKQLTWHDSRQQGPPAKVAASLGRAERGVKKASNDLEDQEHCSYTKNVGRDEQYILKKMNPMPRHEIFVSLDCPASSFLCFVICMS